jgi:hypothetical protein
MVLEESVPTGETLFMVKLVDERRWEPAFPAV